MLKIDHIGIAVKSLQTSVPLFEQLLNTSCYKTEEVVTEKVNTAFFGVGESKVELIADTEGTGTVTRFIESRGEGMHHIAFAVDDIYAEIERLTALGFTPLGVPKPGADNKLICFLHPRSTNGVLVELCQDLAGL